MISAFDNKFAVDKGLVFLGSLLMAMLVLLALTVNFVATKARHDKEYISMSGEERVLSQSIVKDAVEASSANVEAFKQLKQSRNKFELILSRMREGDPDLDLPPAPEAVAEPLQKVTALWNEFKGNADTILEAEGTIRMLSEFVGAVNETMPTLLAVSDEVVSIMIESGANAYLMKGLVEDSIDTSLKAIQLNADFAPAHNNLAIAYLEKGAYDLAAEHADKAVKLGYDLAPEIRKEIDGHRK